MLKKASLLSYPTLAHRDAPFPNKAAGESKPEAYPLGYVEGLNDARTKLADFFSILLERVLRAAKSCTTGAAVHGTPVSVARAKTDRRLEPGSAAHRFDRPTRRALRI